MGMMTTNREYPTPRRLLRRAGFTMVEVAFVSSVLGVVTLMSAGKISHYIQERRVASAAAIVQSDLQQAFAIAARNRRPVRVTFTAADTALRIADRDGAVTYIGRRLGSSSGLMLTPSDVSFCTHTCTGASVDVFPNGWASDTLSVTIHKGGLSRAIKMSRSGLVVSR
jgi:type II secretory pathway pseudopilin PulG